MLNNLLLRTKLILLLVLAILAVALVGAAGLAGLNSARAGFAEVADVRLPSIEGLYQMKLGNREVRIGALTVFRLMDSPATIPNIAAQADAMRASRSAAAITRSPPFRRSSHTARNSLYSTASSAVCGSGS